MDISVVNQNMAFFLFISCKDCSFIQKKAVRNYAYSISTKTVLFPISTGRIRLLSIKTIVPPTVRNGIMASIVKKEMANIAVRHDIVFPLHTKLACGANVLFGFKLFIYICWGITTEHRSMHVIVRHGWDMKQDYNFFFFFLNSFDLISIYSQLNYTNIAIILN